VKCLTVWQPWAELIVMGVKDVENRSWPTLHRGSILIHAAARMRGSDLDVLADEYGIALDRAALELGAVLGAVDVVDCRREVTSPWHHAGAYGWYLANPRRLLAPIPCKGKLRLFDVPDQLLPESWRP